LETPGRLTQASTPEIGCSSVFVLLSPTVWVMMTGDPRKTVDHDGCYCSAMRKTVAVVVIASIFVAACSSANDNASTGPTTTPAPPTTADQPTSSTEAVTTTAATSTTIAPSTTISDEDRFRAAEQAFIESWEAYHAAILDPANPELRAELERLATPGTFQIMVDVLDGFVEGGIVAKPHPSIPAEVSVVSDVLYVPGEQDLVDFVVCEINSEFYFEVGTAPDGSDALIRDEVYAVNLLQRMAWDGTSWRLHSGEVRSEKVGVAECSE